MSSTWIQVVDKESKRVCDSTQKEDKGFSNTVTDTAPWIAPVHMPGGDMPETHQEDLGF